MSSYDEMDTCTLVKLAQIYADDPEQLMTSPMPLMSISRIMAALSDRLNGEHISAGHCPYHTAEELDAAFGV